MSRPELLTLSPGGYGKLTSSPINSWNARKLSGDDGNAVPATQFAKQINLQLTVTVINTTIIHNGPPILQPLATLYHTWCSHAHGGTWCCWKGKQTSIAQIMLTHYIVIALLPPASPHRPQSCTNWSLAILWRPSQLSVSYKIMNEPSRSVFLTQWHNLIHI